MKIKTRSQLSVLAYLVAIATIIPAVVVLSDKGLDAYKRSGQYNELTRKVFAMNALSGSYLFRPYERTREQWESVYSSLGAFLEQIKTETEDEDARTIDSLMNAHKDLLLPFTRLVEMQSSGDESSLSPNLKEVLTNQISVQLQAILSQASELMQESQRRTITSAKRFGWMTIPLLLLLAGSGGGLLFTNNRVVKSILSLHEATTLIGGKKWNHKVTVTGHDEIGELAGDFNEMAQKLRDSYASLEVEIAERKRAEEELTQHRDHLERLVEARTAALSESEHRYRNLFESMSEGAAIHEIICDEEGHPSDYRYLDVNTAFEEIAGLKAEDIVGRTFREIFPMGEQILVDRFGQVALTGKPDRLEYLAKSRGRWLTVGAFKTDPGRFATVSLDITDRKRAEEALRHSEATLRGIFRAAPVGICIMKNRVYQKANDFWCESFGYPEEEILGKNTRMLYESDEEYDRVGQELLANLIEGGRGSTDTRLRRSDGVIRDVVLTAASLRSDDPSAGTVVAIHDITERKRAEEALLKSQAKLELAYTETEEQRSRLDAMLKALPVGVVITDAVGGDIKYNRAYEQVWGGTPPSAQSTDDYVAFKAWWPDSGRILRPEEWASAQALEKGEAIIGQLLEIQRFDGSRAFVINSAAPVLGPEGEVTGSVVALQDITDLRKAEVALSESERRYRNLFETMSEAAALHEIICDEKGRPFDYRYIDVNPAFERITGLKAENTIGRTLRQVFPEAVPYLVEPFGRVALTGEPADFEYLHKSRGRWFELSAFQTHPGSFASVFQDITHRKRAEDILRKAKEELETRVRERTEELDQKNKELESFAYVASHDLQEPLRKIQMFSSVVQESYKDRLDERGRDYLERMENGAKRMQDFILALLEYSRAGTNLKSFEPVNLSHVAKTALSNLYARQKETGGKIEIEDLPTVKADNIQMVQLFQNLIGNALKFHGKDRPPVIKIHSEIIQHEKKEASCRIYFEDNGIGFDQEHAERIFAPFERLHGRGAYEGKGIGLATCRKIVERHGGTITAKSVPGEGSTFIVDMPVKHG